MQQSKRELQPKLRVLLDLQQAKEEMDKYNQLTINAKRLKPKKYPAIKKLFEGSVRNFLLKLYPYLEGDTDIMNGDILNQVIYETLDQEIQLKDYHTLHKENKTFTKQITENKETKTIQIQKPQQIPLDATLTAARILNKAYYELEFSKLKKTSYSLTE